MRRVNLPSFQSNELGRRSPSGTSEEIEDGADAGLLRGDRPRRLLLRSDLGNHRPVGRVAPASKIAESMPFVISRCEAIHFLLPMTTLGI